MDAQASHEEGHAVGQLELAHGLDRSDLVVGTLERDRRDPRSNRVLDQVAVVDPPVAPMTPTTSAPPAPQAAACNTAECSTCRVHDDTVPMP